MAGVLAPDPVVLDPLRPATLEQYSTTPVWRVAPLAAPGPSSLVLPAAGGAWSALGILVDAHGHAVFNRIHILPREKDLGAVGTLQQFEAEVWNAFLKESRTLSSITVVGTGNVTVVDHLGQPAEFPATASELYTLQVPGEGDPVIDSLVTWIFVGIPSAGATDLVVLGFRMLPFGFDPNRADDVVESIGYLTDVMESYDGTEQRVQLRSTPVGTIGFSVLLVDLDDVQEANAILYSNQARPFGVPRWQWLTPLTAPAAADDVEVLCDPTDIPFEVGGLCMLWTGPRTLEVHTIAEIQADRLVLDFPLELAWPAGALVVPMVIGRLSSEEVFSWESLSIGSQDLVFSIDRFKP